MLSRLKRSAHKRPHPKHHHHKKKRRPKKHHHKRRHHAIHHAAPHKAPPPQPPASPPQSPRPRGPAPVFGRDLGHPEIKRLLWRAGFGPRSGDVDRLAGASVQDAVFSLTRPSGAATLSGPEPHDQYGLALAPYDSWGHDHLWWMDRMVRSNQQLVERMALVWHDWFATSNDAVGSQRLMLGQNDLFRQNALGSFHDLLLGVTQDPAMLVWLNGIDNRKGAPNENYARELMELFTLGADRGAYTETDVRQLALALTGFRADWVDGTGWTNFRYDPNRHDTTTKTVFGQSGNWDWQDAIRLVLENPAHTSFFVTKLWGYFIPTPPDAATQAALQDTYVSSGYGIRPVLEAILMHPDFYAGAAMVKPPVVYAAGLLRGIGRHIDTDYWSWACREAGQQLFYPPNVSGWDDSTWLDTSTWRGRWYLSVWAVYDRYINPWQGTPYDATEDEETALNKALGFLDNPTLTSDTRAALLEFSRSCLPQPMQNWQNSPYRAMRQNALRQLIATAPDFHTC